MDLNIGIGEYQKKDYQEILKISEDKDNMDKTWEEWKASKNRALEKFKKMGLKPINILVKPKELVQYCREKGLKINGKSRADFITYKVTELSK